LWFLARCERANLLGVGKRFFVACFNGTAAIFFTEVLVAAKTRVKIELGHLRVGVGEGAFAGIEFAEALGAGRVRVRSGLLFYRSKSVFRLVLPICGQIFCNMAIYGYIYGYVLDPNH
jgi:hypothetical protein